MKAFPQASPLDVPLWGDVIAIYTFSGKGLYGAYKTTGILQAAFLFSGMLLSLTELSLPWSGSFHL